MEEEYRYCDCEDFILCDQGPTETEYWDEYSVKCPNCGEIYTHEPDWDSMSGGKDDY